MDPISDMLARIKNANLAGHPDVVVPMSKMKAKIAEILLEKKFILGFQESGEATKKYIKLNLRYFQNERSRKLPYIQGARRVSKPGQRIYAKKDKIPFVKSGRGMAIVSTSRGLMADAEARHAGLGGEVIFEIW